MKRRMMSLLLIDMAPTIVKNATFMTVASIGQKIISFIYFTMVARSIGVEGTGKYFFALSFTTIFVVFVDLGFTQVLIREVAKTRERLQEYVETALSVKLAMGFIAYAGAVLTINMLGYPEETKRLVYLSGITMLFDSLHLTFYGAMRSVGDLRFEAGGIVGSQIATMILGSIFLFLHLPIIFLILAFTISSFLNVCFIGIVLRRVHGLRLFPRVHRETMRRFARIAVPFAIAGVFARVYSYADSILLSRLAGDAAVGWYSIPYKITYAFQFVPLALIAAVYPRFSEYYVTNRERLSLVLEQSLKYLLLVVAPIVVGIFLLAEDIVMAIYTPEYLPSIAPLKVLIISLLFSYVSFPIGALLNACDRQKIQTTIVGAVMACNIALNLLLIPRMGALGAAIAAALGNMLLTVAGAWYIPRIAPVHIAFFAKMAMQITASAGVMGFAVWYTNERTHFLFAILVGAVVYPTMLFVTRAIVRADMEQIKILFKK